MHIHAPHGSTPSAVHTANAQRGHGRTCRVPIPAACVCRVSTVVSFSSAVVATGETNTVRAFIELAFECVDIKIVWKGKGVDEVGYDAKTDKVLVRIDPKYFRPTEVELLIGDPTKAKEKLGWVPTTTMQQLCREMVQADIKLVEKGDLTS